MAGLIETLRQYLRDSASAGQKSTAAAPVVRRSTVAAHPEFGVRKVRSHGTTITIETRDFSGFKPMDLRDLPASEYGIQGYSFYVEDRAEQISPIYRLVREPANKHDGNAIAVFNGERKVGYVSASKASSYAPVLDSLTADSFLVGGVVRDRGKMLLLLPLLPALRTTTAR